MANMVLSAILKAKDNMSPAFKKARQSLEPMGRQLKSVGRNASALGGQLKRLLAPLGALGSIISVAGLAKLIQSTAALGNKIGNMAKETGLSTQFLQEYGHVVTACGMESQDFYSAMEKMNSNMGKLRAGTGPLVSGLQKVSPALLKQLKATKSNEEAFTLMLSALGKVTDAEKRAYLTTLFFGAGNEKMAGLADLSADALAQLGQQAREFGLVMDDVAISDAQSFSNALTDLKNAAKGLGITIGTKLLPLITPLLTKLSKWIAANRELIATKVEAAVKKIAEWLEKVDFDKILAGVTSFISKIDKLVTGVGGARNAFILLFALLNAGMLLNVGRLVASIVKLAVNLPGAAAGVGLLKTAFMGLLPVLAPIMGLLLPIVAAVGVFVGMRKLLGKQGYNTGMAVVGTDAEGNPEYYDPGKTLAGHAAVGGGRFIGNAPTFAADSAVYTNKGPALPWLFGKKSPDLNAAMAGAQMQPAKADITVDFKHVIPGTNIEYTTSGDGINLKLDTAYGPGPQ